MDNETAYSGKQCMVLTLLLPLLTCPGESGQRSEDEAKVDSAEEDARSGNEATEEQSSALRGKYLWHSRILDDVANRLHCNWQLV